MGDKITVLRTASLEGLILLIELDPKTYEEKVLKTWKVIDSEFTWSERYASQEHIEPVEVEEMKR